MDSPSDRVPERAPERFWVATEAYGGGTPDLSSVMEVLGYKSIYGCRRYVRGATRVPRDRGAPCKGGHALLSRGLLEDLLT